jgi:hypothetical protein
MGRSQVGTARFSNLLALAVIVLTMLTLLSVLADVLVPRSVLRSNSIAEICIGQRVIVSSVRAVWLQGIWLTAPPRISSGQEFNSPGTFCGLIPWFSRTPGMWYREIR